MPRLGLGLLGRAGARPPRLRLELVAALLDLGAWRWDAVALWPSWAALVAALGLLLELVLRLALVLNLGACGARVCVWWPRLVLDRAGLEVRSGAHLALDLRACGWSCSAALPLDLTGPRLVAALLDLQGAPGLRLVAVPGARARPPRVGL